GHLPRGEVGDADVTHLALANEVVEGAQGLLLRRAGVGEVGLVEVEVVGPQATQAVPTRLEDVTARQTLVVGAWADADRALGGEDELLALPLQPGAEDLLGAAGGLRRRRHRVGVGGVEEENPRGGGLVEDGKGGGLIALVPE